MVFIKLIFDNALLRKQPWICEVIYQSEKGESVSGKLYLFTTSFTFRRPDDEIGRPFLSGELSIDSKAISVAINGFKLKSTSAVFRFSCSVSSAMSLRFWIKNKREAINTASKLSDSFLTSYWAYPHPFTETHKASEEDKDNIFVYLRECIPIFQKKINWGLNDIYIHIDDKTTEFCIDSYRYSESENCIRVDCDIFEAGFFDDSGFELKFFYEINYLGFENLNKYNNKINNDKLNHRFNADRYVYPKINGEEDFIAENPFGLKGFYRIKWSLHFD